MSVGDSITKKRGLRDARRNEFDIEETGIRYRSATRTRSIANTRICSGAQGLWCRICVTQCNVDRASMSCARVYCEGNRKKLLKARNRSEKLGKARECSGMLGNV